MIIVHVYPFKSEKGDRELFTKFRIFRKPIAAKPGKVTKITEALHNYFKISETQNPASMRLDFASSTMRTDRGT